MARLWTWPRATASPPLPLPRNNSCVVGHGFTGCGKTQSFDGWGLERLGENAVLVEGHGCGPGQERLHSLHSDRLTIIRASWGTALHVAEKLRVLMGTDTDIECERGPCGRARLKPCHK